MKKKLITKKYQNGGKSEKTKFQKFLDWFSQASLNAAVAGSPSVATAAGWRIDENNKAVQDQQTEEGTKQLQDNLAVISTVPHIVTGGPQVINAAGKTLTTIADSAGKVGTAISNTGVGKAVKSFITNPWVDYALTLDGLRHIPEYVNEGVDNIKNQNYLNAVGNFGLVGLEGFGMTNMVNNLPKMSQDIKKLIQNTNNFKNYKIPQLKNKSKNYFNRITAPKTSIKNHVPYSGDNLELFKQRLINGGFDKLEIDDYLETTVNKTNPLHVLGTMQESEKNYKLLDVMDRASTENAKEFFDKQLTYDVNIRKYLSNLNPKQDPTHPLIKEGNAFYSSQNKQIHTPMVGKFAKLNKKFPGIVDAHELQHAVDDLGKVGFNYSDEELNNLLNSIDYTKINKDDADYLNNLTEMHARIGQIKNYFGITDPHAPVTEDMWNYARRHYVKDTGMDNQMQEFFRIVKDPKTFLSIINKKVAGITGTGVIGAKAISNDKNNQQY